MNIAQYGMNIAQCACHAVYVCGSILYVGMMPGKNGCCGDAPCRMFKCHEAMHVAKYATIVHTSSLCTTPYVGSPAYSQTHARLHESGMQRKTTAAHVYTLCIHITNYMIDAMQ